jgi:4'-phosphopantetheinyl transferase
MNAIRVACVDPSELSEGDLASRYVCLLDDGERRRHEGYVFNEHRLEYMAGCVVAKKLIAASLGARPRDIRFRRDPYGRPHIDRPVAESAVRFSISHTKGRAVCALSPGPEIGVDIERTDRPRAQLPISSACFCASELAALENLGGQALSRRFAQYWTLKEAYGKAIGKGLGVPFERICCRFGDSGEPQVSLDVVDAEPKRWQFKTFHLGDRHVVALAFDSPIHRSIRLSWWRPESDTFVEEPAQSLVANE